MRTYLLIYGVLALGHIAVQMMLGHLEYLRQRRLPIDLSYTPSVSFVVTVYNEDTETLRECLRSIEMLDYPNFETLIVDDGSPHRDDLFEVLEEFVGERCRVIMKANSGKRHSQRVLLDHATGEVIVTVDSDTVLARDALRMLVQRLRDPRVGAVTGNIMARNAGHNLLTKLIDKRYWTAFNQERASQSYFGVMMCCSGPLAAYRRSVLEKVKDAYVDQWFLGRLCTFGDDRHLTNLVLPHGYRVVYDSRALAWTEVPEKIGGYIRQQVRWNKSFYREMLWTARFCHRRHPYMAIDLVLQAVLPFMLVGALFLMLYQTVNGSIWHLGEYVALLVGVALLRSLYGLYRTHDRGFLLFVVYGFIHVLVLMPVRLYALATMRRTHWGTRGVTAKSAAGAA